MVDQLIKGLVLDPRQRRRRLLQQNLPDADICGIVAWCSFALKKSRHFRLEPFVELGAIELRSVASLRCLLV
jgi:hypothetical protein